MIINVMQLLFSLEEKELDEFVAIQGSRRQFGDIVRHLSEFLIVGILEFIKCFDAIKSDNDPKNYYMEREWRVAGNINFSLDDVERIIISRRFAAAFRADVSDYKGQLHFVD